MEFLQSLFEERLESLAKTFLRLLKQLELTVSPFTEPILAPYKVQYLEHLILGTLEDERERYILRLSNEIKQLKNQLNQKSFYQTSQTFKKDSSSSTCSRDSAPEKELPQVYLKNLTLSQKQKKESTTKNIAYLQQTYFEGESSIYDSLASNKLHKKRKDSQSWTSIRLEKSSKSNSEYEEKEEDPQFNFKYLRLDKNY